MIVFGGAFIGTTTLAAVQDKEYIIEASDAIKKNTFNLLDKYKE
jgi:nitrate reductase NapE component